MSTIYRISTDPDRYDSLLQPMGDPLDDWWPEHGFESWGQVILAFNGQPLRHRWKAVRVEHAGATLRRNRGKPVDFMTVFGPGDDAISQRALDLLTPLLDKVEVLPLECVDQPERRYYLLNITDLVDCLDLERSELEWDETHDGRPFIRFVYRYAFKPGSTDGHYLFSIVQQPRSRSVLVSEEFKQLYDAHNLVGLDFYPATEYLPYNASPTIMRERRERENKGQRRRKSPR